MRELVVPVDDIRRLTDRERFTYYVMGHIFNELLCLQKLIAFALPKHDDTREAIRQPEMGQALFLFRLACSKIWEARTTINQSVEISATLRQRVLAKMKGGPERLREVNKAIGAAPWLSKMRNGIGFHFPTFADWQGLIIPDDSWAPDSIYLGEMTGNTFYAGSDTIAHVWMFGLHGTPDLREAVEPMIEQMINLLRLVNSFLEDAMGVLVTDVVLTDPQQPLNIGEAMAPDFAGVAIPFWTAMPSNDEAGPIDAPPIT